MPNCNCESPQNTAICLNKYSNTWIPSNTSFNCLPNYIDMQLQRIPNCRKSWSFSTWRNKLIGNIGRKRYIGGRWWNMGSPHTCPNEKRRDLHTLVQISYIWCISIFFFFGLWIWYTMQGSELTAIPCSIPTCLTLIVRGSKIKPIYPSKCSKPARTSKPVKS